MAQIAQQEPIVIKCGYLGEPDNISEEVKTKLRKCYLRGTLMDVQLECDTDDANMKDTTKVIAFEVTYFGNTSEPEVLTISAMNLFDAEIGVIDCGVFQPSDYEDNAPLDE